MRPAEILTGFPTAERVGDSAEPYDAVFITPEIDFHPEWFWLGITQNLTPDDPDVDIYHVGVYYVRDESGQSVAGWRALPVLVFAYHNPAKGERPTHVQQRVVVAHGAGSGEHEGHRGQGDDDYIVGTQIGTINSDAGKIVLEPVGLRHFATGCMLRSTLPESSLEVV